MASAVAQKKVENKLDALIQDVPNLNETELNIFYDKLTQSKSDKKILTLKE